MPNQPPPLPPNLQRPANRSRQRQAIANPHNNLDPLDDFAIEGDTDPKLAKKINYLYKSGNQIVICTALGMLIPFTAILGPIYAHQIKNLLAMIDQGTIPLSDEDEIKIQLMRNWSARFYIPTVLFGVFLIFMLIAVILSN